MLSSKVRYRPQIHCTVLKYTVFHRAISYHTALYHTTLYRTVRVNSRNLFCITLYRHLVRTILYRTVLKNAVRPQVYCAVLKYTVLHCSLPPFFPCHIVPYHTTPYRTHLLPSFSPYTLYHLFRTVLKYTLPCCTIPYRSVLYRTALYRTVPKFTVLHQQLPYRSLPYPSESYRTVPNLTEPYRILPYRIILLYGTLRDTFKSYRTVPSPRLCYALPFSFRLVISSSPPPRPSLPPQISCPFRTCFLQTTRSLSRNSGGAPMRCGS